MINDKTNEWQGKKKNILRTRIDFQCVAEIKEVSKRGKLDGEGNQVTWYIIKDSFGASFSCFRNRIAEGLELGKSYMLRGRCQISKGVTYLNLHAIEPIDKDDHLAYLTIKGQEDKENEENDKGFVESGETYPF